MTQSIETIGIEFDTSALTAGQRAIVSSINAAKKLADSFDAIPAAVSNASAAMQRFSSGQQAVVTSSRQSASALQSAEAAFAKFAARISGDQSIQRAFSAISGAASGLNGAFQSLNASSLRAVSQESANVTRSMSAMAQATKQASTAFNSMATAQGRLASQLNATASAFDKFGNVASNSASKVAGLQGSLSGVTSAASQSASAMQPLAQQVAAVNQGMTATGQSAQSSIQGVLGLAGSITKITGVAYVAKKTIEEAFDFSTAILETQAGLDKLRNGFTAISGGSAAQAAEEIEYLRKTANRLGLDLTKVADSYLSFSAATKGSALEGEQTRRIFESISGAMMVLGRSAEDTNGALLALQQMVSKGSVQSEELKGQLGERLPGAFQAAAHSMNRTEAEFGKMLQKGEVLASDLLPRLADELDKRYAKGVDAAADSAGAALNRNATAWNDLKQAIVDSGLSDYAKNELGSLTTAMGAITTKLREMKNDGTFKDIASGVSTFARSAKNYLTPAGLIPDSPEFGLQGEERLIALQEKRAKIIKDNHVSELMGLQSLDAEISKLKEKVDQEKKLEEFRKMASSESIRLAKRSQDQLNEEARQRAIEAAGAKFWEHNQPAADKYRERLVEVKKIFDQGGISAEKYKKAVDELNRKIAQAEKEPKGPQDPYISEYKSVSERIAIQNALIVKLKEAKSAQSELTDSDIFYKKNLESLTDGEKAAAKAKVDAEIISSKKKKSTEEEVAALTGMLDVLNQEAEKIKVEIDLAEQARAKRLEHTRDIQNETAAIYQKLQADTDNLDLTKKSIAAQSQLQAARVLSVSERDVFGNERLNTIQEEITLSGDLATATIELALARAQARKETMMFARDNEAEIDELNRQISGLEKQLQVSRERDTVNAEKRINDARLSQFKSTTEQIRDVGIAGFEALLSSNSGKFKSWTDSLKETFKRRFAEELYKTFAEPYVIQIIAQITGVQDETGQSVQGSGGLGGLLNSLFSGGSQGSEGGSGIMGSLGSMFGGQGGSGLFGGLFGSGSQTASGVDLWNGVKSGTASVAAGSSGSSGIGGAMPYVGALLTLASSYKSGNKGASALSGAAAGAQVGTQIMPGWGTAIGAVIGAVAGAVLSHKGGPKEGGSAGLDISSSGILSATTLGRMFTPNSADTDISKITDTLAKSFTDSLKQLGGTSKGVQFSLGFDTDPKGKAETRISSLTKVGGQDALVSFDRSIGKGTENLSSELTIEAQRMLVAALKSSELNDAVRKILDEGIPDAAKASKEQIERSLSDAAFWNTTFIAGAERVAERFGETVSYDAFKSLLSSSETLEQGFSRVAGVFDATNLVALTLGRDINKAFGQIGLASIDARQQLIDFAGGVQSLTSAASNYYQNFFTEAERNAKTTQQLTDEFAKYGLSLPKSRAEFRALAESLDLATEGGRKAYAELIGVADAFAVITDTTKADKEAQEAADKAAQEAQKALEEAQKAAEEAAKRFADSQKLVQDVMDETAKVGMTDYQRSVFEIGLRYQEQVKQLQDLGYATDENIAKLEAYRKAQLAALEDDRTKKAADAIAGIAKEFDRMNFGELDRSLSDIADRYQEQMRQLIELDRATVQNVAALDRWKQAMVEAALATSAIASVRRLGSAQGANAAILGIDVGVAKQAYDQALAGLGKEIGLTVDGVRAALDSTGQSLEGAAYRYWGALTDAQKQAVAVALDAKAAYVEAVRSQFEQQNDIVKKQVSDLQAARTLGASIDQDIAGLRVELGQTTRDAVIAEQMSQIAREWQSNWQLKTIEEQVAIGEKYRSLVLDRYQIEVENATKLKQFAYDLGDYLKSLRVGNLSNLSLEARLAEARRQFEANRVQAAGGDERAQKNLTASADTLLQLGRDYFASSMGYTELFNYVTSSLEGLGAESKTDAEKQLEISDAQKAAAEKAVAELTNLRAGVSNAESAVTVRLDAATAELKRLADKLLSEGAANPVVAAINALPVAIRQQLAGLLPGAGITPTTPTATVPTEKSYSIGGQAYSAGALRVIAQPMLANHDWQGIYNLAKSSGLHLSDVNEILGVPSGTAEDLARQLGLPMFADGGVVTKPMIGAIGEAGPEAIIPLDRWSQYGRDPELLAEIRALREEVAALKIEAARTANATEAQIVQSGAQHTESMAVANEQLRTDRDTNAEVKRMADRR